MLSKMQKAVISVGIGICLIASMLFVCNVQWYTSRLNTKKQALESISDKFVVHVPVEQDNSDSYGYNSFSQNYLKDVQKISQNQFGFCPIVLPLYSEDELIINSEIDLETTVIGTDENFINVSGLSLQQGSFLNKLNIEKGERVCAVSTAVLNYFGLDADNASVMLNGEEYKIIGVFTLAPMAGNAQSLFNFAPDNERLILMPYTALNNADDNAQINYILSKPYKTMSPSALADLTDELSKEFIYNAQDSNTALSAVPLYKIYQMTEKDNSYAIIAAIAVLSAVLLVLAGFNIMQITKAAVYGSQREIAIKIAVGASAFAVCKELLNELSVLCAKACYFGLAATALLVVILNCVQGARVLSYNILSIAIGIAGVACMLLISILMPFRAIVRLPISAVLGIQREGL